jgi:hypothetical protein
MVFLPSPISLGCGLSSAAACKPGTDAMAQKPRRQIREADLGGFRYFKILNPILERLHPDATARDRAGNRQLHFDHYTALLLLYFFNPIVTSLRGIQQASMLDKVQKLLGVARTSLGSLSEAARVFDPDLLRDILGELACQAVLLVHGREAEALRGLTAVDGSLLPALPKMVWALWNDDQHRAAKMHVHFDVLRGVPVDATVTDGNASETVQLRRTLQSGRLYVIDRGYAEYQLFQDIVDAGSGFIGRFATTPFGRRSKNVPSRAPPGRRGPPRCRRGPGWPRQLGRLETTPPRRRSGHRQNQQQRPTRDLALGHQSPRPRRRTRGARLPLPLGH